MVGPSPDAAGSGSFLSNRWVLVGGGAVLLAIVAVVLVLVLGGEDQPVIDGREVSDEALLTALGDAEALMNDQVTLAGAAAADDAMCFLSKRSEKAADTNSFVRCGPVLFSDAKESQRWMTGRLYLNTVPGSGETVATVDSLSRNESLSAGEYLFRPDGKRPSDQELELPDPPAVDAGYTAVLTSEPPVQLDDLDDAVLVGLGYRMTVSAAALVDRIGRGPEALIPADGEQFLVANYELERTARYSRSLRVAVDVDGVKRSLDDVREGKGTVVVAVDDGAEDVLLEVQEDDTTQAVSVLTGERRTGYPMVLYRDQRRIAVNGSLQLPFNLTTTNSCGGPGTLDVAVTDAELVWSGTDSELVGSNDRLPRQTAADRAHLVLKISAFRAAGAASCSYNPEIPGAQVAIVLPDSTQVTATAKLGSSTDWLAFDVPADISSVTLRIAPGDGVPDSSSSAQQAGSVYNFGASAGEIPMNFGAAFGGDAGSDGSTTTTTVADGD